jgi:hypothetical protein
MVRLGIWEMREKGEGVYTVQSESEGRREESDLKKVT